MVEGNEYEYLGLRFMVDTNFFPIDRFHLHRQIWDLFERGAIRLASPDVLGTEIALTQDPEH